MNAGPVVCVCGVLTTVSPLTCPVCTHLESALQGPECVNLLIDHWVLAASNERSPEVVMSERLLLSCQRHASFLYAVHHHAHLIHW